MKDSVRHLYSAGRDAFDKQEFDEALVHFQKLVKQVDSFADVWNMMGQVYHGKGEFRNAIECFERAYSLNPRYTEVQFNLAVAYSEIGQYDKAEALYQKAREAEPGDGDARIPDPFVRGKLANMHADIGDVYHGLALFDDAVVEYDKALSLRPEFPDIRLRKAQTLFDSGQCDQAISELKAVKADKPEYAKARIQLGVFLYSQGDVEKSVLEWQQILDQDPNNERAKMYLRLAAKKQKW
jgi:tetratricopeptide (TPR) repeat protein